MAKRLLSVILTITMCFSLASASFTLDTQNYNENPCEKFTITFPKLSTISENENRNTHNLENIQAAKEFVSSLGLTESGFKYIEQSCLDQLSSFEELPFFNLETYSVLVPKTRAATPTYYGTYNGIDFYSANYSEYTNTIQKIVLTDRDKMQNWIKGIFNLALSLGPANYSIAFAILQQKFGSNISTNYIVHTGAYTESFFTVYANCRGIYTKAGTTYTMRTSQESGEVRPFVNFYPNDINLPGSIYTDFEKKYAETSLFANKNAQLAKAYAQYVDAVGVQYDKISTLLFTGQFQ